MTARANAQMTARRTARLTLRVGADGLRDLCSRSTLERAKEREAVHTSSSKVYERKVPGQGTDRESTGWLNRDSNAEYPANIPRRIEPSECAKERGRRGWMHSPTATACTADPARRVLRSRRARSQPSDRGMRRRHRGLAGYAVDLRHGDQRLAPAWPRIVPDSRAG